MRYPRRNLARRARQGSARQDFWLSFSDLMSVLLLMFILFMFYILYKYFVINGAYEEKLNQMLTIEAALSEKQTALSSAQETLDSREAELTAAQGELDSAQTELTSAQEELAKQQLLLNLARQAMDDSEEELQNKQEELDSALALLTEREGALTSLQSQLDEKQAQLEGQQQQLEALVGVRSRIIQLLSETLKHNSISAKVDPVNGSIMLQSDVLFAYGSAELTSAGKEYIDKFLPVYLSVILAPDNAAYVSEIIVEGHTDPTDTYIKNLRLSQNRAYAVAEYVLDEKYAYLTEAQKEQLRVILTANGRSKSDPVYDENGQVDADASRRVVFKFRLTDEQMIEQMQAILDGAQGTGNE